MKQLIRSWQRIGLVLILSIASWAQAEDIDLFLGSAPSSLDRPNVLFLIDNTANWSQSGDDGRPVWDSEQEALARIFRELPVGDVNVGIMMYTETGGGNSNTDGGYVRAAIRNMTETNKELYAAQIESFDINADKGNGGKSGVTFSEVYRYFAGETVYAGNNKVKTDYDGNPDGTRTISVEVQVGTRPNGRPIFETQTTTVTADQDVWDLPGNALDSKGDSPYNSPLPANFCGKNFVIFISNGANQDNNSDTRTARDHLAAFGGDTSQISITPSGSADNVSDEWARFMKDGDHELGITTFTIDVNKRTNGQGPGWTALLKSIADESGGTYYDADGSVEGISDAVNDALSRILAVNTVFASVALPASANTQSTFINQVYIGLFRPDEDANPRWVGNLKQFKLGFDTSTGNNDLRVLDADDSAIIDSGTGFIRECARSFWTPETVDTYWDFLDEDDQRGACTSVANSAISNFPDGPVVEKGAQAYRTRLASPATREVLTVASPSAMCSSAAGCGALDDFDTLALQVTSSLLGLDFASGLLNRDRYINWARGYDTEDEDGDLNLTEMRPSVHGDIIHSQPVAIDYAADPNDPDVVVFYGGNDGLLRAINGNRELAHNSANAGDEFWAFMPPEFYGQIGRNLENSEVVRFPATGSFAGASGSQKPYGPDGPITAYNDGATKYLYLGMRRAGRSVYGFDISNINSPSLMWRQGCPNLDNDTGCATDWDNVGQTWSPMTVTSVEGQTTPYLVMGGGYDDCEDADDFDDPNDPLDTTDTYNHQCTSASTKGNSIYVLDGTDGSVLQTLPTERAVPGKVTVVTVSDDDQNIKYAYAADTGGNVYRISGVDANTPIGTTVPSTAGGWTITKIADLGCGTTSDASCTANRKFIFGPDVVRVGTEQYAVLPGSGDREKPLVEYGGAASVTNYFFGLFDTPSDPDWLTDENGTCNENSICLDSLTAVDPDGPITDGDTIGEKGWALQLRDNEQVVSGALTVADTVNFSTQIPTQPDPEECSNDLGTATTYNIGFRDGTGDLIDIIGGGLVPTPVAGKVQLDDGSIVPFCIGCGGENSSIGGSQVTSGASWSQPKSRVYWKIVK